jgi:hypothetical protein
LSTAVIVSHLRRVDRPLHEKETRASVVCDARVDPVGRAALEANGALEPAVEKIRVHAESRAVGTPALGHHEARRELDERIPGVIVDHDLAGLRRRHRRHRDRRQPRPMPAIERARELRDEPLPVEVTGDDDRRPLGRHELAMQRRHVGRA